jgi:hypothetical protein
MIVTSNLEKRPAKGPLQVVPHPIAGDEPTLAGLQSVV